MGILKLWVNDCHRLLTGQGAGVREPWGGAGGARRLRSAAVLGRSDVRTHGGRQDQSASPGAQHPGDRCIPKLLAKGKVGRVGRRRAGSAAFMPLQREYLRAGGHALRRSYGEAA